MITNKDYISVVIPFYLRDNYLAKSIESIHQYADMPFELVVHDDYAKEVKSAQFRDKISTLILNYGLNMGLPVAANRAINISSSDYILFMNQDCVLTKPIFKRIKEALDHQYIGILSFYGESGSEKPFRIVPGIGAGCLMAFRRDYFNIVGGFNTNTVSGCGDTPIIYKCWKYGYFRGYLSDAGFRNLSLEEQQNRDSSIGVEERDNAFPKLFNTSIDQWRLMRENNAVCQKNQDVYQLTEAGDFNMTYWHEYSKSVVRDDGSIDWKNAKKHGQDKWRYLI